MRSTLCICWLLTLSTLGYAQSDLISQLANQVCRCMETIDHAAPPTEQARECVRIVGLRHKKELLDELRLNPESPAGLSLFSERMADRLSRNCPVLFTLRLDDVEPESRWSDRSSTGKAGRENLHYKFSKNPPADPAGITVSEPPAVWRVTGSVVGRPGRGSLRLRLPDGKIEILEYPAAVRRRSNLTEGQIATAVCNREWRKVENGGNVAMVVRSIE